MSDACLEEAVPNISVEPSSMAAAAYRTLHPRCREPLSAAVDWDRTPVAALRDPRKTSTASYPLRSVHGSSALPIRPRIVRVLPVRYADPGVFSNRLGAGSITASRAASVAFSRAALLRK